MVGEVADAFGVRGWIKVRSYTAPPESILGYTPWTIGEGEAAKAYVVLAGKLHGNTVVASLEGLTVRETAAALNGRRIWVDRDQFPPLPPGEFYWADLIGLEVRTSSGVILGKVANMIETGANDVMEVQGERLRLVPFVMGEYVKEVRLDEGFLMVDWDPDF